MNENREYTEQQIKRAVNSFEQLLRKQVSRNHHIKKENKNWMKDKSVKKPLVIGICEGDGIGPIIMKEAIAVLIKLLKEEIRIGNVELRIINGFTFENRIKSKKTVPDEVLDQLKYCDVLLKGPTTTPNAEMSTVNLESANVYLRREFDLFANVRPVSIAKEKIDWTFFRENTEGEYALGSKGIKLNNELTVDFKVTTEEGTRRIARAAYEFARKNGKKRVSIITKANIMKKTDGMFLNICKDIAKEYPEIETDSWFVDIMAANLVNKQIRNQFQVFLLPNLYGDILTDEAAQIQGGVGTAGSANIGSHYAIFEAIHGSAPRMIEEGLGEYANPSSLLKATEMLLKHIGYIAEANRLEKALKLADEKFEDTMKGIPGGTTCRSYADFVIRKL